MYLLNFAKFISHILSLQLEKFDSNVCMVCQLLQVSHSPWLGQGFVNSYKNICRLCGLLIKRKKEKAVASAAGEFLAIDEISSISFALLNSLLSCIQT